MTHARALVLWLGIALGGCRMWSEPLLAPALVAAPVPTARPAGHRAAPGSALPALPSEAVAALELADTGADESEDSAELAAGDTDRGPDRDRDTGADNDSDADYMADVIDRCPDAPEDVDGFEDHDGCPEPDVDHHHAILDIEDRCPDVAPGEVAEDLDGCPDTHSDTN